jgi:hypothetical protein
MVVENPSKDGAWYKSDFTASSRATYRSWREPIGIKATGSLILSRESNDNLRTKSAVVVTVYKRLVVCGIPYVRSRYDGFALDQVEQYSTMRSMCNTGAP